MLLMLLMLLRLMSCCDETQLSGVTCRAGVPIRRAVMVAVGFSSYYFPSQWIQMGDGAERADVCHKICSTSVHTMKSV